MVGLYWFAAFVALLLLHYRTLPSIVAAILHVPRSTTRLQEQSGTRFFLVWSALIALYTAVVYLTSAALWADAAYLGTFFFLSAPVVWLINFASGAVGNEEDAAAFDYSVGATLAGSLLARPWE